MTRRYSTRFQPVTTPVLEDLSAHVLDIAQNSIAAEAGKIEVTIRKPRAGGGLMEFEIKDDGKGMDEARLSQVLSPFCTSRTTRRVGMGLPFLKQSSELCGGKFEISSAPEKGTQVRASFAPDNIDTPPLGDLAGAFLTLLIDAPKVRWIFKYESEENSFELDSQELAEAIDGLESLTIPEVAMGLKTMMEDGIVQIDEQNKGVE